MDVLGRYRNLIVLVGVLFAQVLGLAVQVKRTTDSEPTRLIRIWAVGTVTPLEKVLVWVQTSTGNVWHNYFYLRGVRAENRNLKQQIERMSLEQVRMSQDADQARRLQALLAFKEQFISRTMAAQVIGSSGSELSRSVYIDKGESDGIKPDMAVITAEGIVGKVLRVYRSTSQVLLIDDQTSGVGAILDKTRLQGILRGTPAGEVVLEKVMSDEAVPPGEMVLTSGGDGIFPKGLLVGRVTKVAPGNELFLNIRVRPAADLSKLEEVLVVTRIDERQAQPDRAGAARAVDILAERLPTVPSKPENAVKADTPGAVAPSNTRSDAKPKAVSSEASAGGGTPAARKTPSPPSSSSGSASGTSLGTSAGTSPGNAATATGTPAMKVSPKPVKAAETPKPQPAVEDSPH
jgi:rod shape-determining protein MreC